jgi:hypothetical protein
MKLRELRCLDWVKRISFLSAEPVIPNGNGRHLNMELMNPGSVNRHETKRASILAGFSSQMPL